jgi:hypothetical protein
LKAAVNTRAGQTLCEMQDDWYGAKRLGCGGFSAAFQTTNGRWFPEMTFVKTL